MRRLKTVIVDFLLFKPVGDDHDFEAGKRRYKHSDGSLWAQSGGVYHNTFRVNEGDITRLYNSLKEFVRAGARDIRIGMD